MKRLLAVTCSLLLSACASAPNNAQDPFEPMNRAIFGFNDTADRAVVKPVAKAYRAVTPQPVRTAVGNVFDNVRDVYSAANNALQANGERTLNDVMRVTFNSTFGLFGLIDIATPMGLKNNKTTAGDTLAHYGWKESNYLVLPLLGPSTVRDATGLTLTFTAEPTGKMYSSYRNAAAALVLDGISRREKLLGLDDAVDQAAIDNYRYVRDAFLQVRAHQLGQEPPKQPEDDINIDDLVDKNSGAAAPASSSPAVPATP